jgi:hypothetical protein
MVAPARRIRRGLSRDRAAPSTSWASLRLEAELPRAGAPCGDRDRERRSPGGSSADPRAQTRRGVGRSSPWPARSRPGARNGWRHRRADRPAASTTNSGPSCGPTERTSIPLSCTAISSRPHASFSADRAADNRLRARRPQTVVSGEDRTLRKPCDRAGTAAELGVAIRHDGAKPPISSPRQAILSRCGSVSQRESTASPTRTYGMPCVTR